MYLFVDFDYAIQLILDCVMMENINISICTTMFINSLRPSDACMRR